MKKIVIANDAKTQAKALRKAKRKLLQDIHRHEVIESKKRYNRQAEKKTCKDWE